MVDWLVSVATDVVSLLLRPRVYLTVLAVLLVGFVVFVVRP
jgi:hypothetical protein